MIEVAIDNSVISHYITEGITEAQLIADCSAFDEMISLAKKGVIELGGPMTMLTIENSMKGGESRLKAQRLKEIIKSWPVPDPDRGATERQAKCLHEIMQDKNGSDSKQVIIIGRVSQARHLVTMDYRFHRQYNSRIEAIKKKCGINVIVMTPSEFIVAYKSSSL